MARTASDGEAFFRESLKMAALAIVVGAAAGIMAVGVRLAINFVTNLFFYNEVALDFRAPIASPLPPLIILAPVVGSLVAGALVFLVSRDRRIRGVSEIVETVALSDGRVSPRALTAHALATTVHVGTGASAGREGAMVQLGAVFAFLASRLLGLSVRQRRALLAAGAGAAVAATFNTPIAGIIFAIEVILFEFSTRAFVPISVASVVGTQVSTRFLGNQPTFVIPGFGFASGIELLLYATLGIFAGALAILVLRSFSGVDAIFARVPGPWWAKVAVGGLIVGLVGYAVPESFGVGYESVQLALEHTEPGAGFTLPMIGLILAAKLVAVTVTRASGGASGAFSPALFLGAFLGEGFGFVVNALLPQHTAEPAAYALVGMAAVYGSVTRASLTAIVMLFEMTHDFAIILPLILCVVTADVLAKSFGAATVYSLKRGQGRLMAYDFRLNVLDTVTVEEIMSRDIVRVRSSASMREVVDLVLRSGHHGFPVVDAEGRLVGMITSTDLRTKVKESDMDFPVARYMTKSLVTITPERSAHEALTALVANDLGHLPVVAENDPGALVGFLTRTDILNVERRVIEAEQPGEPVLPDLPLPPFPPFPPFRKDTGGPRK